jgi:serine/threonine-protein kinase
MHDVTQPLSQSPADPAAGKGVADLSGSTLGDFRILRRLGQGGMGHVYLAEQLSLNRKVALKFLRPDLAANAKALERFDREAKAVARVTHANIVQVYAVGAADGLHYMALEYVEGRNLREYIDRKGPPELPIVMTIMRQVAAALQKAGEVGLVHRDIKPENILLTRKGEVKVADFGLSRVFGTDQDLHLTQSGMTLGTPLYMSPEQVQGLPLDPRSDIYSFGVTCYHMLAGQPPFRGANAFAIALQHVQNEPPPLAPTRPDSPPELCALVHRMMSKDPDRRPQTGREILRELSQPRGATHENPFAELTRAALPTTSRLRAGGEVTPAGADAVLLARPPRRSRLGVWLGVSMVLALAAGIGLRLLANSRAQVPADVPHDDHPSLPVVSEREQQLQTVVEMYAKPKPDRVREGAGRHVELGVLYLEQKRYDEAEKFFRDMAQHEGAPQVYMTISHLGLAITSAMRDEAEKSVNTFQELKIGVGGRFGSILGPMALPPEDLINLRFWVLTALERNATHKPLPTVLERLRSDLKTPWVPRTPPGGAGKRS